MKETLRNLVMLECDPALEKLTGKVEKKFKISWDEAVEEVNQCFRELCCPCWLEENKKLVESLVKK